MPASATTTDLRGLPRDELTRFCAGLGIPPARARQVLAWLYRPGTRDFAGRGTLGRETRALLARHARIGGIEPEREERSADGTVKLAFRLADGAAIESVIIPGRGRRTLCVSSQAGCAMGCRYCLTGGMGLRRDLEPAEIVGQVVAARDRLLAAGVARGTPRQAIDNLVFMGMGEPLANYGSLVTALRILMDDAGMGFTERRVTVSTCGVVPRIADLGRDVRVNLAVSLHTVDDEVRSRLMPVNRRWGVDELLAACRAWPRDRGRVILFECVLIDGVNDAPGDAVRLAEKLRGIPCRVNLLPYNGSPSLPWRSAPRERVEAFRDILHRAGYRALIRQSRGADIAAACGQLAGTVGEGAGAVAPKGDACY